jgi:hypothetical protein
LFSPLEDKSHIFAPPCNILYLYRGNLFFWEQRENMNTYKILLAYSWCIQSIDIFCHLQCDYICTFQCLALPLCNGYWHVTFECRQNLPNLCRWKSRKAKGESLPGVVRKAKACQVPLDIVIAVAQKYKPPYIPGSATRVLIDLFQKTLGCSHCHDSMWFSRFVPKKVQYFQLNTVLSESSDHVYSICCCQWVNLFCSIFLLIYK